VVSREVRRNTTVTRVYKIVTVGLPWAASTSPRRRRPWRWRSPA